MSRITINEGTSFDAVPLYTDTLLAVIDSAATEVTVIGISVTGTSVSVSVGLAAKSSVLYSNVNSETAN